MKTLDHDRNIGDYARKHKFSSGSKYFCGKDWMVKILIWADSYYSNTVDIYTKKDDVEDYYNQRIVAEKSLEVIFTNLSLTKFIHSLGCKLFWFEDEGK